MRRRKNLTPTECLTMVTRQARRNRIGRLEVTPAYRELITGIGLAKLPDGRLWDTSPEFDAGEQAIAVSKESIYGTRLDSLHELYSPWVRVKHSARRFLGWLGLAHHINVERVTV